MSTTSGRTAGATVPFGATDCPWAQRRTRSSAPRGMLAWLSSSVTSESNGAKAKSATPSLPERIESSRRPNSPRSIGECHLIFICLNAVPDRRETRPPAGRDLHRTNPADGLAFELVIGHRRHEVEKRRQLAVALTVELHAVEIDRAFGLRAPRRR